MTNHNVGLVARVAADLRFFARSLGVWIFQTSADNLVWER